MPNFCLVNRLKICLYELNCLHIHLKDGFEVVDKYPKTNEKVRAGTDCFLL
jgi:hypothetical protein